ncbi:DNA cytosine methyltransferase [Tissierella praeacuta]|uniref:DNA cytosine methyltransferase n=1 Tax=Tissierella praeacuta TaxID=43131 RepID=UPI003DA247F3
MKIGAIDLFCGIGGLTHGLIKANIDVIAGIDYDESCKYAYEENNKSQFIHKNIEEVSGQELNQLFSDTDIKILVGCAPCQPFSNHQKDKNNRQKHKDWGLLNEFLRLIKETDPDIVSMENVPILRKEDIFNDFLAGLEEQSYHINYKIHDAQDFGVAQRRSRLVLIASKYGAIDFIEYNGKRPTVKDVIGDLPKLNSGETDKNDPIHKASKLSELNLKRIQHSIPGGTWKSWPEELLPNCYKKKSGSTYVSVYGRMSWDDVAPTLTTQFFIYGTGRYGHPEQDRPISLREGAMLQSFPRNYKFVEDNQQILTSILARHIGNAVPPKLGEYIGNTILHHLRERGVINE